MGELVMKKLLTAVLVLLTIITPLTSCQNFNDDVSDSSINSYVQDDHQNDSLKSQIYEYVGLNKEDVSNIVINFKNNHYEIYDDNVIKDFVSYLENSKSETRYVEKYDYTNSYGISLVSSSCGYFHFYVNDDDILQIFTSSKERLFLYKKNLYDEVNSLLKPVMEQNDKFYSVEYNDGEFTYSYKIFDKQGNVIESGKIMDQPNISLRDNNVVCMWTQAGIGSLVRGTDFYDTNTGKKSPHYGGIVDSYNNLVANSTNKSVLISDMFTGRVLQVIDNFGKELYDGVEPIIDLKFIEDGTKVSITYLAEDSSEQTEIFDVILPKNNDLPEWKTAYLDFLKDKNGEYISFSLVYIDGDDIPELYMNGVSEATGDSISSYKNGKVIEQLLNRTGGGRYIENGGQIFNYNGNFGYYQTHMYQLDNNGFNQTFNAYLMEHLGDDKITYEYSVEDKLVSKEEYNTAINAVFDIDNSVKLNENAVSYDAIRQQILDF